MNTVPKADPPGDSSEFPARQIVELRNTLQMRAGDRIERPLVAYETWGQINAARDNVVLLFTGLSPSAHAASSPADPSPGWWEGMLGEGLPIDTSRYFVICVNAIGSPFGSSSPVTAEPRTGRRYGLNFPDLSLEDIAAAAHGLLEEIGIERVSCAIGPSLGGMVVLAYCAMYPGTVERMISISGAAAANPFAIALRSLQRELVRSDPKWIGGMYKPGEGPKRGLRLARKLGTITYRSAVEWNTRFGRERIPADQQPAGVYHSTFQIESYLEHLAQGFSSAFDANCYMQLSRAMDWFDLADHGEGSLPRAFERMQLRSALVIGVDTDILFPVVQQRELAEGLKKAGVATEFHAFPSVQGHDSFLIDLPRFGTAIGGFLGREPTGR